MGVPPGTPDDNGSAWQRLAERWNQMVAQSFLTWLAPPRGLTWLDVNCGDGVLTQAIAMQAHPARVWATDPQTDILRQARQRPGTVRVSFHPADATALPFPPGTFDRVVNGLGLATEVDLPLALTQLRRVLRPGGEAAFYVWDQQEHMQPRYFFRAAAGMTEAGDLSPTALGAVMTRLGFSFVATRGIDIPVLFRGFDAYWSLFQTGTEPEARHCQALDAQGRDELRARLEAEVPARADGSLAMIARAWAMRGTAR